MHILNPVSHQDIGQSTDLNLALNNERLEPALQVLHDVVPIERSDAIKPQRQTRHILICFLIHIVETSLPSRRSDCDLLQTESVGVLEVGFQAVETMRNRLDEQSPPIAIGKENITDWVAGKSVIGADFDEYRLWHQPRQTKTVTPKAGYFSDPCLRNKVHKQRLKKRCRPDYRSQLLNEHSMCC